MKLVLTELNERGERRRSCKCPYCGTIAFEIGTLGTPKPVYSCNNLACYKLFGAVDVGRDLTAPAPPVPKTRSRRNTGKRGPIKPFEQITE
jgi:hypothetical protein